MEKITLASALMALEKVKERIFVHEVADDMYYSSQTYRDDKKDLKFWEDKVKELGEDND